MAYQARRKQVYTEVFELAEEDGTVVHTLHVHLDPDHVVKNLSAKHTALVRALGAVQGADAEHAPEEALNTAGTAVKDLLEAVFGQEDTQVIVDFYEGRYIELCQEVLPFIEHDVVPKVRKLAQELRRQTMQSYNRPQRRFMGRKV